MGRMGHSTTAAALPRHAETAWIATSTPTTPFYRRYCVTALTLSIMALCLLLRTLRLGTLPLFFDEGVYTRAAQVVGAVPGPATLLTSLQYGAPPLYSWLAAPLTRLLPDPLLAARLTSALIGTATALAVWAIARTIPSPPSRDDWPLDPNRGSTVQRTLPNRGRGEQHSVDALAPVTPEPDEAQHVGRSPSPASGRGALDRWPQPGGQLAMGWGVRAEAPLAAVLYALCPFTLFYNRMALLDGLLAACGGGALYFALRLARDARGRDAFALGLCLGAAMLTKIFAVDMLLLPLLAVVAARPAERRAVWRLALVAAALGLAPLAALLLTPQGGGLLSATHAHAHAASSVAATVGQQLATWGAALWLYLTPPVLLLALLGLWSIRRQRAALVIGPWALLGGLPPVLVPGAFLAPRYFLYSAVPILVLAAYGLVALVAVISPFAPPAPMGEPSLAPPAPSGGAWASRFAPPAPPGGAWGDASPQTPAKQTVWPIVEQVLVSESVLVDTVGVTDGRGAWRGRRGRRDCRQSPISRFPDSRDECMAGVWGEASPQAPPEGAGGAKREAQALLEARWIAGRSRGASQPWAGGGEGESNRHRLFTRRVQLARGIAAPALLVLCAGLAVIPSVQADAALIGAPAHAPYIPFDRWQYVTGWPSGYALMDVVTYLRRQERHGPITVVSSIYNPPGDALAVLLGRDPRVTLVNRDFDTLRAQPLRDTPGRSIYVIACHPYGQQLHPDARDLRAVLRAPDGDGAGGVDVYAVIGR